MISAGVPFTVSSITHCPVLPNHADTLVIGVSLIFSGGGGSGEILSGNSVHANRSWSGSVTFSGALPTGNATLTADCQDFNGVTGTPYATYEPHSVTIG